MAGIRDFVLTRTSVFNNIGSMTFPAEMMDPINAWLDADRRTRPFVQAAFPYLNDEQREFLLTGITPGEWDDVMGTEE